MVNYNEETCCVNMHCVLVSNMFILATRWDGLCNPPRVRLDHHFHAAHWFAHLTLQHPFHCHHPAHALAQVSALGKCLLGLTSTQLGLNVLFLCSYHVHSLM